MTTADADFSFSINVPLRNEWRNVALVVSSVQNCFNAMFADVDGSDAVAMVACELLENAIKFGAWTPHAKQHLRIAVSGNHRVARVVVENPSDPVRVGDLEKTLAWIASFPSPAEAYRERVRAVAEQGETGDSKLGLVRVAHEGRCALSATVQNDTLRVEATLEL